jgi:hypothetical protein
MLFLRTRAINVTTATRGKERSMSTNTIDSANSGAPKADAAEVTGKRKAAKKATPAN